MPGNVAQDGAKSPGLQRTVPGNGQVMLATLAGGEAHVAAGLAGDPLPSVLSARARAAPERSRGSLIRQ
jgi:hypothetical protein